MSRQPLSRGEVAFILGVPAAWAILLLFHPGGEPDLGNIALVSSMIAAGVALRDRAGAPLSVAILLGISPFLISAHPPPYGPTGLALFIIAVLLFLRSQSTISASCENREPQGVPRNAVRNESVSS